MRFYTKTIFQRKQEKSEKQIKKIQLLKSNTIQCFYFLMFWYVFVNRIEL